MADQGDFVGAMLFWAVPALTSAERLLVEENFSPWGDRSSRPSRLTRQADAVLMLLALRNVLRAARWAAEEVRPFIGDEADRILERFDRQLPGLVNARDALEHFDEYALGRGRLQKGNDTAYEFQYSMDGARPVVTVGPIRIDVEHARDVCRWLVVSLLARVPQDDLGAAEALLEELLAEGDGRDST